jgi:para-aminobenzoate synthetase component 1
LYPPPDPWEACRRLAGLPHLIFFDSASKDPDLGRYSFLTADPFVWLRARRGTVEMTERGVTRLLDGVDPFAVLAGLLARWPAETLPDLPPFQGGAAGLLGYDLCHHLERLPRPRYDEFAVPDLAVGFYDWVLAFDHTRGRTWVISTGLPAPEGRRRRHAAGRLREVLGLLDCPVAGAAGSYQVGRIANPSYSPSVADAHGPCPLHLAPSHPVPGFAGLLSNFDRAGYEAAVRRGIDYVHAGDCFQVNLAQRMLFRPTGPALELYGRLRERNPAPFAGYFDLGDFAVVSASPERFVRVAAGQVETRPIKGTRPRGATEEEDARNARALQDSPKDRAENVMIVDLLRNDLGKVCRYGTVRVAALCRLESFRTVHHLVSEVHGILRRGQGPVDLLRAVFPGGSVTGAPKVRAMEIIAELEPTARGPYCGSLGYIGFDGATDTSILIRTICHGKGWWQFPVGGGIVADSTPEGEYEETLAKASGLLRALIP